MGRFQACRDERELQVGIILLIFCHQTEKKNKFSAIILFQSENTVQILDLNQNKTKKGKKNCV